MARINVEDDIEATIEWKRLVRLLQGNANEAMGMLLFFWRHAQKLWGHGELVPDSDITEWGWEALVKSGWAKKREGGYYAIGAKDRFAWYVQRVEAGKSGGRPAKRDDIPDNRGDDPAKRESKSVNPLTLTLSPSLSLSQIQNTNTLKAASANALVPAMSAGQKSSKFIAAYVKAFQAKYGAQTRPDIGTKVQGEIQRLLKSTPLERAIQLIQVYLQMDDRWFETKTHDFTTFANNLNKIGVALDTGQNPGGPNWGKVFGENHDSA